MKSIKSKIFSVIIGLLFLAGAAVFVANQFFDMKLELFFDGWWTLFLIIPGFMGLFGRGTRIGGLGMILCGGCLLARAQGLLPETVSVWKIIVACILVMIGLSIIAAAFGFHGGSRRSKCDIPEGGSCDISAVFGERKVDYSGIEFCGGDVNGIFGSVELDMRGAVINSDCKLEANAVFGNVVILAGANARYAVSGTPIFGSVNDSSIQPDKELPTVTVNASSVFGSVEVK